MTSFKKSLKSWFLRVQVGFSPVFLACSTSGVWGFEVFSVLGLWVSGFRVLGISRFWAVRTVRLL